VSFSKEDKDRTSQYQAEASRVTLKQQFTSIDDYLKSLGMVASVSAFEPFHYPRIAQLTQRSNQFNLRTIRYTEAEIEKIAEDDRYLTLSFCLKDKFGDHGLISVVILEKQEEALFINEWLMSCRVLKRSMEEFIINKVIEIARANGFKKVIGEYIKTSKNAMVERVYEKMDFHEVGEGKFVVEIDRFEELKTYIYE
jgi:FkbH-like protein